MPSYQKVITPHIICRAEVKVTEARKSAVNDGKTEASESLPVDTEVQPKRTPFAQAVYDLSHVEKVTNDLAFVPRVGLYELGGEIGSGNFSKVKMGVHDLTKGKNFLQELCNK